MSNADAGQAQPLDSSRHEGLVPVGPAEELLDQSPFRFSRLVVSGSGTYPTADDRGIGSEPHRARARDGQLGDAIRPECRSLQDESFTASYGSSGDQLFDIRPQALEMAEDR